MIYRYRKTQLTGYEIKLLLIVLYEFRIAWKFVFSHICLWYKRLTFLALHFRDGRTEKQPQPHFSRVLHARAAAVAASATCPSFFSSFNPERVVPLLCTVFSIIHKRDASLGMYDAHTTYAYTHTHTCNPAHRDTVLFSISARFPHFASWDIADR